MEHLISANGIVKVFANHKEKVLNKVDIDLARGEFTVLMGPSGSGKSTLLFALSGMDGVTEGTVTFDGAEIAKLSDKNLADLRRVKMGFIFQQATMLKNLNILDNIILPAMQDKKKNTQQLAKKGRMLMQKTGINGLETRDITEVSGGQLQRAGICRALINDPDILFADEPTGALNSKSADEIMELLAGINKEGTAILLVTHDAKVAARADRVLFINDGMIKSDIYFGKYNGTDLENRAGKVTARMAALGI